MSDTDDALRDMLKDFRACCAATRRESTDIFVRFLIRQGLGPLGKLSGRRFAACLAGSIIATELTSVSVEEVAALDEDEPGADDAEGLRMVNMLRGAGWIETMQGWRVDDPEATPLPLAEAYAELRRQMRSDP